MVDLKPCPFCGGEAEVHPSNDWDSHLTGKTFFVWCDSCETRGDYYATEAEAIAAWNTRAEQAVAATLGSERHPYELRITGDGSNWGEVMRDAYDDLMDAANESCTSEELAELEAYIMGR